MEKVKLNIGVYCVGNGGITQDNTRSVEFEAEKLAEHREYGEINGHITDTRGLTQTLYRTADGRLVVYEEEWSYWQCDPNHYALLQVTAEDLGVDGRFEGLGRVAGRSRPLTLDEALED